MAGTDTKKDRLTAGLRRFNWRLGSFLMLVALGMGFLLTILMVQATSRPQFCGSCHVMAPYYDSWKTSSHAQVACVDCHIPPGIYSEIEKKKEAISMVVSYFTGTYGTNPWAEVDDAACLQCHQRRLLAGKEVFSGILFDHSPHLTELRREKQLRCTSCHSQIVQGSHIKVTTSTCVLCHFKDQKPNTGTAECILCHDVPDKVIEKGKLSFNHADVERFDMQCSWCHAHVTKGDGSAPRQRCYVCHNDPERLTKYDDHLELHRTHVTEHKVECMHCHTEIQHGSFAGRTETAGAACGTCHSDGHSPQRDLYVGIGAKGVQPRPSTMHLAGIHCEGCHFLPEEQGAGHVQTAGVVSCMACHGPRYSKMLDRWKSLLDSRIALGRTEVAQARTPLGNANQQVTDVETNLRLLERGHGVHNVDYALDILAANHTMLNEALAAGGHRALPPSWKALPYESECLRCHQGIETQKGTFQGKAFAHKDHVVDHEMDCQKCHRPHEERPRAEIVSLAPAACAPCHHAPELEPEERCATCHRGVTGQVIDYQGEEFAHDVHVEEEELACADCHLLDDGELRLDLEVCADCHD